jgi:hypothetical protein
MCLVLDLPLLLLGDGAVHGAAVAAVTVTLLKLLLAIETTRRLLIHRLTRRSQLAATASEEGLSLHRESQHKKLVCYTFS